MALLPVGLADAGNWPIDGYSIMPTTAAVAASATIAARAPAAPLPVLPDDALAVLAEPPVPAASGDTYLLFADGFYARNETSSWMPYIMFGAEDEPRGAAEGALAGPGASAAEPELRLGIGLHRRLIDRMDLTLGYRAQYRGPSVIEDDDVAPIEHKFGLRLRYRF